MDELTLNIDEIEEKLKSKRNKLFFILFILSIGLLVALTELIPNYNILYDIFIVTPISTFLLVNTTYYFLLSNIFCPYCKKHYFQPFFANKEEIKSLMKSNPVCIHCNQKANIVSDYKVLY